MNRTCVQCGKTFSLSEQEIEVYEKSHLELPVCCSSCRRQNRIQQNVEIEKRYFGLVRRRKKGAQRKAGPLAQVFRGKFMFPAVAVLFIFSMAVGNRMMDNYGGPQSVSGDAAEATDDALVFRDFDLLTQQFEKYGRPMGYKSSEDYLAGANEVVSNPASLHKNDGEGGDSVYFLQETGDAVVVSADGYIRTYFRPEDGIDYFYRQ